MRVIGGLRQRLRKTVDASTSYNLDFPQLRDGEKWHVQTLTFRDATTDLTRVEVIIDRHGYDHLVYEEQAPVAGYLYRVPDDVWVFPGELLRIRFVGGGSSDEVEAIVTGLTVFDDNPGHAAATADIVVREDG